MFGQFQKTSLRIEVTATQGAIAESLTHTQQLRQWLFPQQLDPQLPPILQTGDRFTTWLGPISVTHQVEQLTPTSLRLLLSEGIDGFHEWYWDDGWLQSRLEGISVLPLNLGHTLALWQLRQHLTQSSAT